jgi:hypothetical protein
MTEYREYIIEPHSYLSLSYQFAHKEYDGPEDRRVGFGKTIADCKQQIDDYIFENTSYEVKLIEPFKAKKFTYMEEAKLFCESMGLCFDNITPLLNGFEIGFDAP